ncbi:MAG: TIGR01777 family oxidoreductase [Sumerlaeia bacterium]
MTDHRLKKTTRLAVSAEEAFTWHEHPNAFERLTPPWENVLVVKREGDGVKDGARWTMKIRKGPATLTWIARMLDYREGRQFRDQMEKGPFASWDHRHLFEPAGDGAVCDYTDDVRYRLPVGALGELFGGSLARSDLERMFAYRHRIVASDLQLHAKAALAPMKILISGSTGLVGQALTQFLTTGGHEVIRLTRSPKPNLPEKQILWDTRKGIENHAELEGLDAVIHLAGENIAGLWTSEKKRKIHDSRKFGTETLAEALAGLERKPRVFLSASAVGIYGDTGDMEVTEANSPMSEGFLVDVARDWEAAALPAKEAGIRVVHPRIGIVLSPAGGALKAMLPAFKGFLGGRLGSGKQWFSWIALDDMVGGLHHMLAHEELEGPVNLCAPNPVTNAEFTKTLAHVLHRPVGPPAPAFAMKAALGDFAREGLLASLRVKPAKLLASGYEYQYPTVEGALRHQLGRTKEST